MSTDVNGDSEGAAVPAPAEKLKISTNPRLFPRHLTPNFISKARNGMYHFYMDRPSVTRNYLWYMEYPRLMTVAELEVELAIPGRRWYATNRAGYELTKKHGCSVSEGQPYAFLLDTVETDKYWVGARREEPPVEEAMLILSIADCYLKSKVHRDRLIRALVESVRRVLGTNQVFRCGNNMIEIRRDMPSPELMDLLTLVPGIAIIYHAAKDRTGDPRGALLRHGAGGMPILRDQKALALISGGIDSPVAAYRMMTRGCYVEGVHFLNSTDDTASVMGKNRAIGQLLSRIQGSFVMHFVDISHLQAEVVAKVPNQNRTLVYKWLMLTLAAAMGDASVLIVGDSIGQVASQTLLNIGTLYPLVNKAIVAPLIGHPKMYIVDEAKKIGTYSLSLLPGADCCQYMMCKVGANLFIGKRKLLEYANAIRVAVLPVTTEIYARGALVSTKHQSLTLGGGDRAVGEVALVTNGHLEEVSLPEPSTGVGPTAAGGAPSVAAAEEAVYFDAGAGTTVHPSVLAAMARAPHGNPSSMHQSGRIARMAIEKVRSDLAKAMRVPPSDLVFTSGGTESNNLALHGYRVVDREPWSHASTVGDDGADADPERIPVRVVELVNHETGSVCTDLRRPAGGRLHVDACQAFCKVDFAALDFSQVDSMSVTAHKINGPVGVGALYVRDLQVHKLMFGGPQEKGVRPGTENVPGIVGFEAALRLDRSCSIHRDVEAFLVESLEAMGCAVNRRGETSGYVVHATLPPGYDNTSVVSSLSTSFNVDIGTGSACKTGQNMDVVSATLGKPPALKRAIRLSYDYMVTMSQAEHVVSSLQAVLRDQRPKQGSSRFADPTATPPE